MTEATSFTAPTAKEQPLYHLPTLLLTAYDSLQHERQIQTHWQEYTGVFIVSQHAARFAHRRMHDLGWQFPASTWLACVGQATQKVMSALWPHQPIIAPEPPALEDSEGLWQTLAAQGRTQAGQRLLIIRAQTGRDWWVQQAQANGSVCDVWSCYQRQPLTWTTQQQQQFTEWQAQRAIVVVSSREVLDAWLAQPVPIDRARCTLVTIHPRISAYAQQQGFELVHTCTADTWQAYCHDLAKPSLRE